MPDLSELLRDADPLQHEPIASPGQRHLHLQVMLAAASGARPRAGVVSRSRFIALACVALLVMVALFLGARVGFPVLGEVHAAVRFEVRLAEDKPAPGLREVKLTGPDRSIYLHEEDIVTNSDISAARLIQGDTSSQYSVGVEFNSSGAEKMRQATENHIGKIVAILLDGEVVMAPVIRSPISTSARITGHFTKAQAEKIVNGITAQ